MRSRTIVAAAALAVVGAVPSARQDVFRSAVDAVAIDAVVTSGTKRIGGLTANDFAIIDNGVAQRILSVSQEKEPIDVTLVIDVSESVSGPMLTSLTKAVESVRQKLRVDDRVSVVTFSQVIRERVALVAPARVKNLSVGPASGMTSLRDATIIALSTVPVVDRRQMTIVFTDGADTLSFLDAERALTVAAHGHSAVFGVTLVSFGGMPSQFLDKVTTLTGGMLQTVAAVTFTRVATSNGMTMSSTNEAGTLDASFLRALEDFRTSYVVRYNLSGVARPGWHDVAVSVTRAGKYTVRARKGYYGS